MNATTLDFLRHGEPLGGKRYRGNGVDDELSSSGWEQMWQAATPLEDWDRIITSPLRRCREFASQVAEKLDIPLHVEPQLVEIGFGAWEGLAHEDVQTRLREDYLRFKSDPLRNRPRGAEPLDSFVDRVRACSAALLSQHDGECLLVVTHAGVIRAALSSVLQIPLVSLYEIKVEYAARVQIAYQAGQANVSSIKGLAGLPEPNHGE